MIFDKEYYDKSLWLMLKADRKNRKFVVDFIKSIPNELYDKIRGSIETFKEYKTKDIYFTQIDQKELSGEVETSDRIIYWYRIDELGILNIGYRVLTGRFYERVITIGLYINDNLADAMDIGYVIYHDSKGCKRFDYNYVHGYSLVLVYCVETDKLKTRYIDINYVPEQISISDLDNKKNINRLVRERKNRMVNK